MSNEKKFDFENIDVKLYLALRALLPYAEAEQESLEAAARRDNDDGCVTEAEKASTGINNARWAIEEFELSHGPLPEWAVARNWGYELVPGAQLCTKDGRRTGNAHILRVREAPEHPNYTHLYDCITDAGSYIGSFSETEVLEQFHIGDWISDPKTLIARFGNHGEDYGLPQLGDPDV